MAIGDQWISDQGLTCSDKSPVDAGDGLVCWVAVRSAPPAYPFPAMQFSVIGGSAIGDRRSVIRCFVITDPPITNHRSTEG